MGVIITPPPPAVSPPILLLTGDEYCISEEGVARTLYRIGPSNMAVEEFYDIESARKQFVLRENHNNGRSNNYLQESSSISSEKAAQGVVSLGHPIKTFDFQEINLFGDGDGTGATTWESSIAMSMFFSSHSELLHGDVVELGSGVGLGGILSVIGPNNTRRGATNFKSMTLTDCNDQVLEQCRQNVAEVCNNPSFVHVSRLDWYDFLNGTEASNKHVEKYDTVIACDCAYRYPDIKALTKTMTSLLRNNSNAKIHIFGPRNRSGLQELLRQLREEHSFDVIVDEMHMQRYRLKAKHLGDSIYKEIECPFAAKFDSPIVHVTCSFQSKYDEDPRRQSTMTEID